MKIAILDDYAKAARTLDCYAKLAGHDVPVFTEHMRDPEVLARRLHGMEALVVIQQE